MTFVAYPPRFLQSFAEIRVWLLGTALVIRTRPKPNLPFAPGALEAAQLWRTIIKLPHCHCEMHVALELGARSAALAIAIVAHSAAFFQCPLLAVKIPPSACFAA